MLVGNYLSASTELFALNARLKNAHVHLYAKTKGNIHRLESINHLCLFYYVDFRLFSMQTLKSLRLQGKDLDFERGWIWNGISMK